MSEIDVKNCPCYIDRPLYRYDKGCLIQSQAFSEQQTKEKPILRCDEIVGCSIKEHYKQLQQLKAENVELKKLKDEILNKKPSEREYCKNCTLPAYSKVLNEIEEIINNFAGEDIITLPDLSKEKNYKLIAEQYAEPIKHILQKIKEVKENDR